MDGITDVIFIDKPDLWIPGATPLSFDYIYNLLLQSGEHIAGVDHGTFGTVNIKNNTTSGTISAAVDTSGHIYVSEGVANGGTINIANNLHIGNSAVGEASVVGASSGDAQVIAYSDYNNFYTVATAYAVDLLTISTGNTTKAIPGSYDNNLNPKFLDNMRNLGKWNLKFGSGTDNYDDAITYLLSINGYRGTPNFDQNGTVSVYGPAHLVEWVRYGFSPTNGALRFAGDPADGSPTIGAMEYQRPRRTR